MKRWLRQGDLLSLFLFLIVVEALQVMIIEACNKGIFKGLSLAEDGANISLVQYADDAFRLFGIGVSEKEVVNIARAVNCSNDSLPSSYLGLPIGK
ncbi:hypothetical protein Tco_0632444 [Tanacetum coccineum]